jgi:tetraacyldisaccharide 4'-kinase
MGEEYFRQLWDGKRNTAADRLLVRLMKPFSSLYSLALIFRAKGYSAGVLPSYRLPRPVVSVGNLTVGGTGKTPLVAYIARWLMERGKRAAVLSRGYGGSMEGKVRIVSDGGSIHLSPAEAGDEPYLLASSLPGLAVIVGSDRYRAGLLAMRELEPDIFILDDGYQHLRLERDLNLLLLDCERPYGNGRTIPAGALREPLSALERADLLIFTRCGGNVPRNPTNKPFCAVSHILGGAISVQDGAEVRFEELKRQRALAFAGIADPSHFFESLRIEGLTLSAVLPFSDHCSYGEREIESLCRLKESSNSDFLITTEKDAVKLKSHLGRLGTVYSARLKLSFSDVRPLETELEKLL